MTSLWILVIQRLEILFAYYKIDMHMDFKIESYRSLLHEVDQTGYMTSYHCTKPLVAHPLGSCLIGSKLLMHPQRKIGQDVAAVVQASLSVGFIIHPQ